KEDPVVHFYETFLKEYDEKIREMRGVYYTPEPVVSYIVRSIDHLLKDRFNKPQGLADDKTLILDPAVGTATFLYMVINEIYQANIGKGQQGLWNNYVAEKLLPRIFGFELLMAPYAVAHLKLGLLLQETGYEFQSDQRLGIYLTNTLEEAIKRAETLFARWISEEANAAARVKKDEPIMVVLGNPPYSVSSLNRGEWIDTLLDDYKEGLHEKKLNIDDDYIKFIRFAQWRIEKTGYGILGFITNNSYLDGLTHRRMREYLLGSFSSIYLMNLHGSSRRGEQAPDNIKDENVFDIQQGVAIGIFVKELKDEGEKHVYYADMWGARESKYKALFEADVESTSWQELKPTEPYFFFVPKDLSLEYEYSQFWSVRDSFVVSQNGLKTDRDDLFFDFESKALEERISRFFSNDYGDDFKDRYRVYSSSSFDIEARRNQTVFDKKNISKCLYRPFDERYLYYDPKLTSRPAFQVMQHMLKGQNTALLMCRQQAELGFHHILCSNKLAECCAVSLKTREITSVFPLYLYPAEGEMQFEGGNRRPNLNPEFVKAFSEKLGLTFIEDGRGDLEETFGPEDIFNYAYAVFHSPTYRTRYAEFLKIDFPRLPLTSDKGLFKALATKGAELVSLHLMESPVLNNLITGYPVTGSNEMEKVSYDENNQRIDINKTQYFEGVAPEVWNFHIGGYHVCQKWLKDRKGRTLTYDELTHYQKVIVTLKETIRLMAGIDELIPGWPVE
ncbi:MAG: type ISP restriction/modification enzyme, partial [Chloroflexota bacterium]